MVHKSKFEETVLESVPQLTIQLINTWMLGQINNIPPLTIFSIVLSSCSLSNTIWFYGYWTLFRGIPIRDVPCTLALYNYKLLNVSDGDFSFLKSAKRFVKQSADVELSSVGNGGIDQEGSLLQKPEKETLSTDAASPEGRKMRNMSSSFVAKVLDEKDAEIARLKQMLKQDHEKLITAGSALPNDENV
jgi:hypothetical protein